MSKRHETRGFISGVTKHDTLVTSASILNLGSIDRLGNIGGLLLNGHDYVAGAVIKTLGRIVVSNIFDGVADAAVCLMYIG